MNRNEVIARACHSAWYAYTVLALGEEGQPWESAPEWQRESILSVVGFWDFSVVLQFPDEIPSPEIVSDWARSELPSLSHENWAKARKEAGWVYGEVKDADKKTHPCLVPYNDLPKNQRMKDTVVLEAYLALREM